MTIYQEFIKNVNDKKYLGNNIISYKKNGKWISKTYQNLIEEVNKLSRAFFDLQIGIDTKVGILSKNCPEWLLSDLAINRLGAISVPIHAVSNKNTIDYIIQDTNLKFLIIEDQLLKKHEFLNDLDISLIVINLKNQASEKLISFEALLDKNNNEDLEQKIKDNQSKLKNNDLASILYTSGTTGNPKGVCLSNKNFLTNISQVRQTIIVNQTDKLLSFLPLSHALERTAGHYIPMFSGAHIFYAENILKVADNLKEVQPTLIVSVPKIFERIYEKIFAQVKANKKFKQKLFYWALKQKKETWQYFLANLLVLKKVRKALGGKIRFAVSGGASLNEKIIRFFKNIGITIIEGYGLTETAPIAAANSLENLKIGTVGQPLPNLEIKIATDKEVLIKGDNLMQGYYQKEELTKEVIDQDGWFHSGDLGFLDKDNFLTIIGRKKDIIVTSNGKNIAPEKLENIINLSPFINQTLIVGHKKKFLAALLTLDQEATKDLNTDEINQKIEKEIKNINKTLESAEIIKKFTIIPEAFSIEAGDLTPTLKVKRQTIENKYSKEIQALYQEN